MSEKTCETCKWFDNHHGVGFCNWPVPFWLERPVSEPLILSSATGCKTHEEPDERV